MSEVLTFPGGNLKRPHGEPDGDILPEAVLANAFDANLRAVVVCGLNADGTLFGASSSERVADTLLLIERARKQLMAQFEGDVFA